MYIESSYLAYLAITVTITIWVARTLHRNGKAFLVDAFHGNADLAQSVNHLLVVGFYLINLGYVAQAMRTDQTVETLRAALEMVTGKLGTILIVLGIMHFFNVYVFHRLRRRGQEHLGAPPIPPDLRLTPRT